MCIQDKGAGEVTIASPSNSYGSPWVSAISPYYPQVVQRCCISRELRLSCMIEFGVVRAVESIFTVARSCRCSSLSSAFLLANHRRYANSAHTLLITEPDTPAPAPGAPWTFDAVDGISDNILAAP